MYKPNYCCFYFNPLSIQLGVDVRQFIDYQIKLAGYDAHNYKLSLPETHLCSSLLIAGCGGSRYYDLQAGNERRT